MNLFGERGFHVLHHAIVVCFAEEIGQEEARDINAFIGVGITVIGRDAFADRPEHLANHVGEEAGLLISHFVSADVRKELLGENVLHIALLLGFDGPGIGIFSQPCQRLIASIDGTGLHHALNHDRIIRILILFSQDQLVDVTIRKDTERAKENDDRDVRFDAWDRRANHGNKLVFRVIDHFDGVRLRHLIVVGTDAFDLDHFHLFGGHAAISKDEGAIFRHALHGDHRALTALNDEVSADIFGALA